ncbi:hypothetical protein BP5796_10567 [Coleophoma crateriformis]|uniref:non-specific serine/threonine protein kinase n=1 Tax=Coleophoma crateriformis TaxID=565419 RepID=A0A3D8QQJ0_9HELO|nr:hypothetical protein BP5796_10567 [Coleophoma crateriformis]
MDANNGAIYWNRQAREAWLNSEATWAHRLGSSWRGVRVLGSGSFGVAGLWQYSASGRHASSTRMIKEVVVKQVDVDYERRSTVEGLVLEYLSHLHCKHLVRQFGPLRRDRYDDREVVRIYLEYCPGGDLQKMIRRRTGDRSIEEEHIWSVFYCLALGLSAMDRGSEEFGTSRGTDTELVHFDIKIDNILIGYRDPDHPKLPICKIADFGEAQEVLKDPQMHMEHYRRGAIALAPPENFRPDKRVHLNQPYHGTCSNIFQVGMIIYQLMLKTRNYDRSVPRHASLSALTPRLQGGFTHGIRVEQDTEYSDSLKALVMECMMREPLLRPRSEELQMRTQVGLASAWDTATTTRIGDLDINAIPVLGPSPPTMFPSTWSARHAAPDGEAGARPRRRRHRRRHGDRGGDHGRRRGTERGGDRGRHRGSERDGGTKSRDWEIQFQPSTAGRTPNHGDDQVLLGRELRRPSPFRRRRSIPYQQHRLHTKPARGRRPPIQYAAAIFRPNNPTAPRRRPGHQFPDHAVSRAAVSGLPAVLSAALHAVVRPHHTEELAPVLLLQPARSRARHQELGDGAAEASDPDRGPAQ